MLSIKQFNHTRHGYDQHQTDIKFCVLFENVFLEFQLENWFFVLIKYLSCVFERNSFYFTSIIWARTSHFNIEYILPLLESSLLALLVCRRVFQQCVSVCLANKLLASNSDVYLFFSKMYTIIVSHNLFCLVFRKYINKYMLIVGLNMADFFPLNLITFVKQ